MRSRLSGVLLSTAFAAAFLAGTAHAVTVDSSNTMTDSVLTNRIADGGLNGFTSGSFGWKATFSNGDRGGRAIFNFKNDTGSIQNITVALDAALSGLRGKFKRGIKVKWAGSNLSMRLKAGKLGSISMQKQFAIDETAQLIVKFGKVFATPGSTIGLDVKVTLPGSTSVPVIPPTVPATPPTVPTEPPPPVIVIEPPAVTVPPVPAAVPLPAAGLLLLTALGTGGLLASRRRPLVSA
jgi:hypothetical protein